MTRLGSRTIRTKIIGLILLVFALLFAVLFYFLEDFANSVERDLGVKLIRQQATITKQRALGYFENDKSLIDKSLLSRDYQNWMANPENKKFESKAIESISSTCQVTHCQGWFLYSHSTLNGFDWHDGRVAMAATSINLQRDKWYTDIIATGKSYFIDASIHPFNGNPYVYFDYFIRENKKLLGLVGTYISIDSAVNAILAHPADGISNLLIDNHHIVRAVKTPINNTLHSQLVELVNGKAWESLVPKNIAQQLNHLKSVYQQPEKIIVGEVVINGRTYLGAQIFIEELEWYAISLLDREIMQSNIDTIPLISVAVVILIAMLALTIHVLNTQMFNPILHMHDVVKKVSKGRYDERVEAINDDELGVLAQGINQMTATLSENLLSMKQQNTALNHAILEADQANKAKSIFLANMSHELRTPMNAVLGFTQIGLVSQGERVKNEYLKNIQQSGEHLLSVINDILDFNKIESNAFSLESTSFRIQTTIHKVLSMCQVNASDKGLKLIVKVDKNIPKHLIGDPFRIEQILLNLITNAIKFTENGVISINASLASQQAETVRLNISVKDTGIGINKDSLEQLFNAFTQADNSITRKYGGTGLGLTITQQLIRLMHGEISVESEVGVGSTFHFSVQLGYSDHEMVNAETQPTLPFNDLLKLTSGQPVLLVEDNDINKIVAEKMLELLEVQLDVVSDGQAAVDSVKVNHYQIVLMDIQMPVLDGIDATKEIRKFDRNVTIIGLSAHASTEDATIAKAAGMNDYLTKPVDKERLFQLFYKHLS